MEEYQSRNIHYTYKSRQLHRMNSSVRSLPEGIMQRTLPPSISPTIPTPKTAYTFTPTPTSSQSSTPTQSPTPTPTLTPEPTPTPTRTHRAILAPPVWRRRREEQQWPRLYDIFPPTFNPSLERRLREYEDLLYNDTTRAQQKFLDCCMNATLIIFVILFIFGLSVWGHNIYINYYTNPEENYSRLRKQLLESEREQRLGGQLHLTSQEFLANEHLLAVKKLDEEVNKLYMMRDFRPRPYFLSKYHINETDLYGILKAMPKGGLLHIHDAGMFKTDLFVELSLHAHLWVCVNTQNDFEEFKFSKRFPEPVQYTDYQCIWQLMTDFWQYNGRVKTEAKLRQILHFNENEYMSKQEFWQRLRRINRLIQGLITYRANWSIYIYRMLEDFYADGVQYVELRSSLPLLYDLERTNYTIGDTAQAIVTVTRLFQASYNDYIGTKLIYAPVSDINRIDEYLENAEYLKNVFPDFFVGFDLVSLNDECSSPRLKDYTVKLLHINQEIDFYFHAGETFCYNTSNSNDNLIDAILLGSKRISSSLALPHHPEILTVLKLLKIAIEFCPISNHYMEYLTDFHAHPLAYLLASGYPIIIGSDYPYFWHSAPLTDDFYVAFVGLATNFANISLLKQLAINSLIYSAMSESEKKQALHMWQDNWNRWIMDFVKNH